MKVEFQKTGERRYALVVSCGDLRVLEMNPAPGFDALMPHDLLHFLVEQELELKRGIFGLLALGGTAETFHNKSSDTSNNRADSRLRRKIKKRQKSLLKEAPNEYLQSERATYICLYDWLAHSADEKLRARALEMKLNYESILAQMSPNERNALNKQKRAEIRKRMDELSRRWSALKIDESMRLDW